MKKGIDKSNIKEIAADLSALNGAEVKANEAAVKVALSALSPERRAEVLEAHGLTADEAEAIASSPEPSSGPKGHAKQFTRPKTAADAPKAATASVDPSDAKLKDEPDDAPAWQLISGPNNALSRLGVKQGDVVVNPTAEVKAAMVGCQRSRMTVADARGVIKAGRGRLSRLSVFTEAPDGV